MVTYGGYFLCKVTWGKRRLVKLIILINTDIAKDAFVTCHLC